MRSLRSVAMSVLLLGCATTPLVAGSTVAPVTARPDGCESLGVLSGSATGRESMSTERLSDSALNDLRNQAAAQGATHVLLRGPAETSFDEGFDDVDSARATVSGEVLHCRL